MARKRRPRPPLPAPCRSACLYCRIEPSRVGMFRFLLEAQDNLGYMRVVDRWAAILQVVYSPHQAAEMREFLTGMAQSLPFLVLDSSGLQGQIYHGSPDAEIRPGS